MTRNEARERLGLSPLDGADDLYISATLFPLGTEAPDVPEQTDNDEDAKDYEVIEESVFDLFDDKALADLDLQPTSGMVAEAKKGLDWRTEHGRGGTPVGIARARDIVNGKAMSVSTVKRMFSFFARHEVDKRAEGFRPGEKGYPSNGRIAWALWGGDPGQSWSKKKRDKIEREENKFIDLLAFDTEVEVKNEATRKALRKKVD